MLAGAGPTDLAHGPCIVRPEARAAWGHVLLANLAERAPVRHRRVLERLHPKTHSAYEGLAAMRWVPMEAHMELSDEIRAEVGAGLRYSEFWRQAGLRLANRPILSGFLQMVGRLSGSDPLRVANQFPRFFRHTFRHVVDARVVREPGRTVLELFDFDGAAFNFECFVEGTVGVLMASGDVTNSRLRAEVTHFEAGGRASIVVRAIG
ncbi:MAG: hypothetical protein AAF645_18635 [Myxococcota bacterium]